MSAQAVERARQDVDAGIAAARAGRFDESGTHFYTALQAFERLPDLLVRREEAGSAALVFARCGHPDLALMAVQTAIDLDAQLGNAGAHCADLLNLANLQMSLRQIAACEAANEAALGIALAHQRYGDAASASTNVAIQCANSGRFDQAISRLQASLAHLRQADHPETDVITRLVLIQVSDAAGADPAPAVAAAEDLFGRLATELDPARWQQAEPAFRRCVDRYLADHPEIDGAAWKQQHFASLYPPR